MTKTIKNTVSLAVFLLLIVSITLLGWISHSSMGVVPRSIHGLFGIPLHPFFHGDLLHLLGNLLPLVVMGLLLSFRLGNLMWFIVFLTILTGAGVWLVGSNAEHIGASGIVFGFFGFMMASPFVYKSGWKGFFSRIFSALLALVCFSLYWWLLVSLMHIQEGVSWAAHISGLISGILLANFEGDTTSEKVS